MTRKTIGAAENVDVRDRGRDAYEEDIDERRVIVATCLSCELEATLLLEAGSAEQWDHDRRETSHLVEYRRVD